MNSIAAIIVAAGAGTRAGGDVPKQFQPIGNHSMLYYSLSRFCNHPLLDRVVVVINDDDRPLMDDLNKAFPQIELVTGGKTRQQSVHHGLVHLKESAKPAHKTPTHIMVHDAARPCLSQALLDRLLSTLLAKGSAVPSLAVVDALKRAHPTLNHIEQSQARERVFRVQTPQCFEFPALYEAHDRHAEMIADDDAALMEAMGNKIALVDGEEANFKVTAPADFTKAATLLNASKAATLLNASDRPLNFKIGYGYDIHQLESLPSSAKHDPENGLYLCGLNIDKTLRLIGHSDADCALHALTDAILAAIAAGDIGDHFPPSDSKWRGASSDIFLTHALTLLQQAGGNLAQIDLTLLAEKPKIAPHRSAMRQRLADITQLPIGAISVKATTMEGLDAIGEARAIACHAHIVAKFL